MAEGTDDWGEFEDVLVEQQVGVVVATLNRPDKLNALSGAMRVSLRRLIRELPEREDAKVLVITGAGSAYFSGQTRSDKLEPNLRGANTDDRLRGFAAPLRGRDQSRHPRLQQLQTRWCRTAKRTR
ncbi:MAG TPA: enoyl-CoA hydratase/isomerase family protein [Dehalococcoidia bacterium]|jgi:enoyl-CoA hydratase/carnithine racemase